jgi:hypothetical protein
MENLTELLTTKPITFADNKSLSGSYWPFLTGRLRTLIIRGNLKTYHSTAEQLAEYTTTLTSLHAELRAQINVPPLLVIRFPQEKTPSISLVQKFLTLLHQAPKFVAFARYLRVNRFYLAILNASDLQMLLVKPFNPGAVRVTSEAQALTKYSAWAEEYLAGDSVIKDQKPLAPQMSRADCCA